MKKTTQYPFLYFGAGSAAYFEWASLVLRFKNAPTPEQKATIIRTVPEPLTIENNFFNGKMMIAVSKQFVNKYIEKAYGSSGAGVDDDSSVFAGVSAEAQDAFEEAITKWLHEVHAFCPVEFVFRDEDEEAGGTELSDWHAYSIKQVGHLVKQWEAEPGIFISQSGELNIFKQTANCIVLWAEFEYDDIEEKLRELIVPQSKLLKLLSEGNINDIHAYLHKMQEEDDTDVFREIIQETINGYCEEFCTEKDFGEIYKFRSLFSKEFLLEGYIGEFIYSAYLQKDDKLIANIIKELDAPDETIEQLGGFVYNGILLAEDWEAAIALYDITLSMIKNHGCRDLSILCNALYVLQNDNTGLPVNKELNQKFLSAGLPYAPQNPAIYFNAACLYVEMKDYGKTLECIQLAREHKYDGYDEMIEAISEADIFAGFRKYPAFEKWNK